MITLLVILFLSTLNQILTVTMTNMKVSGGNFGLVYKFTIIGTIKESIPKSENYTMKISYNENIEGANCSQDPRSVRGNFIYICIYSQNINAQNIYIIRDDENFIEISENIEIKPFELTINNIFAYHLEFIENNHWQFYLEGEIEQSQNQNIELDYMTYMDIKVNNAAQIAGCSIKYYTFDNIRLICKINSIEQNNNDVIIIPKTKSEINTLIFFPELEEDKSILKLNDDNKMINLEILGGYDYMNNYTYLGFKILTANKTIDSNLNDKKIFVVKIEHSSDIIKNIPCIKKDELLFCESENPSYISYGIDIDIPYPSEDSTENEIKWTITEINSNSLYVSPFLNDIYLDVYDFSYNHNYKYYDNRTYANNFFIVLDITINSDYTFIYCYYDPSDESNQLFKCKSKIIEDYNESNKVKLSNIQKYCYTKISIINPYLNVFYLNTLLFYDYHYENAILTHFFKIELENDLDVENIQVKFHAFIDLNYGYDYAYCDINHKILNCKYITSYSFKNIRLGKNDKGQIRFNKIGIYAEFTHVANFRNYSSTHYFDIHFKSEISFEFFERFDFYLDYIYNNTQKLVRCKNKYYPLDFLECTFFEVINPDLIRLTNNKTKDSTITWINEVPEGKLEFFLDKELINAYSDNLLYDIYDEKWKFDINTYYNYSYGEKFILDLIYNGYNSTAICKYKSEKKFLCIPDIEIQRDTDIFTISSEKNKGTVIIANTRILSYAKLKLELAYDKKISIVITGQYNPWENNADETYSVNFKIRLSESNITVGRSTVINVKCDDEIEQYYTADCTMNISNTLHCYFGGRSYTLGREFKNLRIIKNLQNKYVQWSNINMDDEIPIYGSVNITNLKFVYGNFMNNIWKFYISYERKIYEEGTNNLIDIYVNNEAETALCSIELYYLNCECSYKNQRKSDIIKLRGEKNPYLGTIYFAKELTEEEKIIKPAKLNIYYTSTFSTLYNNGTFYFTIYFSPIGSYAYYDKLTEIEIVTFGKNDEEFITKVSCIANEYNHIMKCYPDRRFSRCEEMKVYVNDSGYSGSVKISPEIINRNIFIITDFGYNCPPYNNVYIPPTEVLTTDVEIKNENTTTITTITPEHDWNLDDYNNYDDEDRDEGNGSCFNNSFYTILLTLILIILI